jgi:hypothetical protein
MEGIKDKAGRYKRLAKDETFIEILEVARKRQIDVFLSAGSDELAIDKAHSVVLALQEIESVIDSVIAEEMVFDKKHK